MSSLWDMYFNCQLVLIGIENYKTGFGIRVLRVHTVPVLGYPCERIFYEFNRQMKARILVFGLFRINFFLMDLEVTNHGSGPINVTFETNRGPQTHSFLLLPEQSKFTSLLILPRFWSVYIYTLFPSSIPYMFHLNLLLRISVYFRYWRLIHSLSTSFLKL